jgi:hypothetical protein
MPPLELTVAVKVAVCPTMDGVGAGGQRGRGACLIELLRESLA